MTENIKVFKQNSIRITDGGKQIYIDPFEMDEEPHDAAFILITHEHYDHFQPESIEKVACASTVLVVPESMKDKANEVAGLVAKIVTLKPGVTTTVDGLALETVRSYNIGKPFHPKNADWVGYILTLAGKRIYVAGDTDATPEAAAVKCDVALVPIGGKYTMDAFEAAQLVNEMRPAVAIPVHYGRAPGSQKDGETFAAYVKAPVKVEIKMCQ